MKTLPLLFVLWAAGCASNASPADPAPAPPATPRQVSERVVVRGVWVPAGGSVQGALWQVSHAVREWCGEQEEFVLRHYLSEAGTTECSCKGPIVAIAMRTRTLSPEVARAWVAGGELVMHGEVPEDAITPQGTVQVIDISCTLGGTCRALTGH